jgi:hypothetical protein
MAVGALVGTTVGALVGALVAAGMLDTVGRIGAVALRAGCVVLAAA